MAKMRIYIVDLESVPTRYTCEWKTHLPKMLQDAVKNANLDIEIINISGGEESIEATPGAFLNFQATNIYKNNQLNDIARRFTDEIKPGDKFLFADAWHTGILQLKYMSELLQIPVEIHALWHAGSYDQHDFLGRLIKDKNWTYSTERALFYAIDHNWFATEFHSDMFGSVLGIDMKIDRVSHTGWPMDYMPEVLSKYDTSKKEDIIIFPHRIAPEKQPEIFRNLAECMPQYKFVICQDEKLTKEEYHKLLAKSKVVWSANLQETLGISPFEGALMGAIPLLPHRLSYAEMYNPIFLYPTHWTEDYKLYMENREDIMYEIEYLFKNYELIRESTHGLAESLLKNFFTSTKLLEKLLRS